MAWNDPKTGFCLPDSRNVMQAPLTACGLLLEQQLIMQEEQHPSAMGIGQPKEGFSVFGIFNQCASPMGKRLLRLWFRRPIINLTAIQDRQVSLLWRASPHKDVSHAKFNPGGSCPVCNRVLTAAD